MTPLDQIKADLRNLLYLVWKHLGLPTPTPTQYAIAEFVQNGPPRRIIEGFRGVAKSWITAVYVLWLLLRNPEERIMVVSATHPRALDFTTFVLRLIHEMPLLQHLRPIEGTCRNSKMAFDVGPASAAQAPSVKSVGIFGQMTGSRATKIIFDDSEIPNNSLTQDAREKLLKAILEGESILVPGGEIILLGTPQTEESVYNKLEEKGYIVRRWPAEYPTQELLGKYYGSYAPEVLEAVTRDPSLAGHSIEPTRFSDLTLAERRGAMGNSQYNLQFLLDTTLSDRERYPLRTSDLVVMPVDTDNTPLGITYGTSLDLQIRDMVNVGFSGDRLYRPFNVSRDMAPYSGSLMFIDPSGRGKDETAYAVTFFRDGNIFLKESGGFVGGYDESNLRKLAKIAKDNKVKLILVEPNFGDGMFLQLLKPIVNKFYKCRVEESDRAKGQKERRIIDTLEPVMNRHKLICDESTLRHDLSVLANDPSKITYSLLFQLTHITNDSNSLVHDDRLDALAGAVAYWTKYMAKDEEQAIADYRQEQLEKELKDFLNSTLVVNRKQKRRKGINLDVLGGVRAWGKRSG